MVSDKRRSKGVYSKSSCDGVEEINKKYFVDFLSKSFLLTVDPK
tara:strand:+ start:1014 stop:1145 length:132 start_codon:yes stop_codon:yes gene_type:complete